MLTAAQVADKWAQNTAGATNALKAGVANVTISPTAQAAQALDRYLSGVQQAVSSGKMAAALNAVQLSDWQNAMNTKAVARIPAGVQAAKPKYNAFMDKWLPYEQALSSRVASMPKGTVADSQARAAFAIAYNAAYSKRLIGS
jgi:hypothetical protein